MAASQQALVGESRAREAFATISSAALRPLHVLVVAPSILFLATLGLMPFHAPDGPAFVYDRLALTILIVIVFLRPSEAVVGRRFSYMAALRVTAARIARWLGPAVLGRDMERVRRKMVRAY